MLVKFEILKSLKSGNNKENFKTSILFDVSKDELQYLKKSLNKLGIIILNTSTFQDKPENFGIIEFKIKGLPDIENSEILGFLPETKIETGIRVLKNLGLFKYTTYINNLLTPLDENKITELLKQSSQHNKITLEKKTQKVESDEDKLKKLREFIEDILKEGRQLQSKATGLVLPMYVNQLKNALDELEKLKRSRNTEKLTALIERTLNLMEDIELKIVEKQKQQEINKIVQDSLSELEILPELEKFKRIQKTKGLNQNIKLGFKDQLYKFLGKPGLLIVLTSKEIIKKTKFLDNYIENFNKYLELFFVLVIVELNIYITYKILLNQNQGLEKIKIISGILYFLTIFGIYGLIFFIGKFFNKKLAFPLRILSILVLFILAYFIKNIILATFALPL